MTLVLGRVRERHRAGTTQCSRARITAVGSPVCPFPTPDCSPPTVSSAKETDLFLLRRPSAPPPACRCRWYGCCAAAAGRCRRSGGGDSSQLMSGVWGGRGTAVGQEAGCGRDGGGAWLDPLDMGRGSSRGRQAVQGLVGRGRGLPGGWSQPVCLPSWASVVGAARSAAASPEAAAATGSTSSSSERLRPHRHLVGCAGAHAGDARRRRQHRLRRDGARCPLTPPRQPTAEACPAALPRCPAERCVSGGVGRWCEAPSGPTAGPLGGTLGSRGLGGGRGADPHVSALG